MVLASFEATPFVAIAVSVTIVTGLNATLHVSENLVFGLVLLLRGPSPLVAPPIPEPDRQLPLLIVQIPGRNEPFNEIRRSIDSVLHLGYPADRIRVQHIDNSDDQRWQEVIAAYRNDPRVEVLHRDGTGGFKAGNLNIGLKKLAAQRLGDPATIFIGTLDVGDTFARDTPRAMVSEFALNDDLAFVQALTQVRNPQDTLITKVESYVQNGIYRWNLAMAAHYGMPRIDGHHIIVRFKALLQVEGWDETKVSEDWATGVRMLLAGAGQVGRLRAHRSQHDLGRDVASDARRAAETAGQVGDRQLRIASRLSRRSVLRTAPVELSLGSADPINRLSDRIAAFPW
ncbi:MAG: glycosyltransferase family 2 protein [Pseudomonadota bacterium]|nr:glycosyltransferase family 2 protein [Pseudomonadota bacterium]